MMVARECRTKVLGPLLGIDHVEATVGTPSIPRPKLCRLNHVQPSIPTLRLHVGTIHRRGPVLFGDLRPQGYS